VPNLLRPPKGEAYARVESQTGELGFYLVSDGSIAPYRFRVRSPELLNLTVLRDISIGWKIADLIAIFASIDIALGEVDR
jgi:NADH-quinone oxidoreductase subunit D